MTEELLPTMDVLPLALSRRMDIAISLKNQIYVTFVETGLGNRQSPVMILFKQMGKDVLQIVNLFSVLLHALAVPRPPLIFALLFAGMEPFFFLKLVMIII